MMPSVSDEKTESTTPAPEPQSTDDAAHGRAESTADALRRFFYTGVGALLATEEGLRKVAGYLPKEAASYVVSQAQHTKDEAMRLIAVELRRFLDNVDATEVLRKVLSTVSLEVKAEIRFKPSDNASGVRAEIDPKISLRRANKPESE